MFKEGIPFLVWVSTNLMKIILLSPREWDSPTVEPFSSFFYLLLQLLHLIALSSERLGGFQKSWSRGRIRAFGEKWNRLIVVALMNNPPKE
jgi:hypothetical protein